MASPVSDMRRNTRKTPSGGPATASARRMNANSVKGAINIPCSATGRSALRKDELASCGSDASLRMAVEGLDHGTRFEQILRAQDRFGLALCDCLARKQECLRKMLAHEIGVVEDSEDGTLLGMPARNDGKEIGNGFGVNRRERLVEENESGILHQKARKKHALQLAA